MVAEGGRRGGEWWGVAGEGVVMVIDKGMRGAGWAAVLVAGRGGGALLV